MVRLVTRRVCLLGLLVAAVSAFASEAPPVGTSFSPDRPWIEVRSSHFRVLTDGGERSARRVARDFERIRRALEETLPGISIHPARPLLVFAARNEITMRMLVPQFWEREVAKPAGVYQSGGEARDYAIVRLDEVAPWDTHILYHEYVHALVHANFPGLPAWLDEGLAEFYASSKIGESETVIGAENPRIPVLRSQPLLPLSVLFATTVNSPYYLDQGKASMFYAESWALVHSLILGPGMKNGAKLAELLQVLQDGTEPKQALLRVFGPDDVLEKGLDEEVTRSNLLTRVIRNSAPSAATAYSTRSLSAGDVEGEVGNLRFWQNDGEDARRLLNRALKDDPQSAAAHEGMGLVLLRNQENSAAREFARAASLESDRFFAIYYAAILRPAAFSNSAADQQQLDAALARVLKLNPQFAPGYFELARLRVRQVRLAEALVLAQRAVHLEPARSDYAEFAATIRADLAAGTVKTQPDK